MISEILTPFVEYQKEDKIKKLKSLAMVTNVVDKGQYLLVDAIGNFDKVNSPVFRYSTNQFKCHEIKNLAKEISKEGSVIISELFYLGPSFEHTFCTLPKQISYIIGSRTHNISLEKAIKIANERCRDLIEAIKNVIGLDRDYLSEEERTNSLIEFLQTMVKHKFYAKHPDFDEDKVYKDLYRSFDKKFVHFWIKENGITTQQLLCDHDSRDQYANDGHWYNSVGTCCKCLIDEDKKTFDSSECDTAYTYWTAALKSYKVKKEKV